MKFLGNLRALFRKGKLEAEMAEEMKLHIELQTEQNIEAGMTGAEARDAALRQFGNLAVVQEEARERRGGLWIEQLGQDLHYALRQLGRAPGFTATVLVTLALSIGACTVIFTVVDSLLLHPLDNPEPDRLVALGSVEAGHPPTGVSPADFMDWKRETRCYESMGAQYFGSLTLSGEGEPRRVRTAFVTVGYLDVFDVKPVIGRPVSSEDLRAKNAVVLISFALWEDAFGGKDAVLGRTIKLNDIPTTVIGVLPENLARTGGFGEWNDVVVPVADSESWFSQRGSRAGGLNVTARLKPGVTLAQAQVELDVLCARLSKQYPDTNKGLGAAITPLRALQSIQVRTAMWSLLGAVGGVLLIACANVANLLLVRASARQREITLRTAFGATRSRLIRLLWTESLLLSLAGGVAGALLAYWGIETLRHLRFHNSVGLGQLAYLKVDLGLLGFALALGVGTALLFGLGPAWLASRCNLIEGLKQGARGATEAHVRVRLRNALVILQVAASLMLLSSVGLLLRSFDQLAQDNVGFDPSPLAYANVQLQSARYRSGTGPDSSKMLAFSNTVLARLSSLPGVESAGASFYLPAVSVGGDNSLRTFTIAGQPEIALRERPLLQWNNASPDYFKTMGIRLLRGRTFKEFDSAEAPRVAVINETMARQYFGSEDPIGRRLLIDNGGRPGGSEIIGVVADTILFPGQDHKAQCYEPIAQYPVAAIHFVVRTAGNPTAVVPSLKTQIHAVDPDLVVLWATTISGQMGSLSTLARQRFIVQLLGIFCGIALVIASVGLHGVIAYSVSRRTSEIGIRMALGARALDVLRLVLGQGARVVGVGLLLGLGGALAAGRTIESMLYHTSARDPVILAAAMLLFVIIAAIACWLPARRAAKVDPVIALRAE